MALPVTFNVLTTKFSAVSQAGLAQTIEDWSQGGGTQVVCFSDTHSVVLGHDNTIMQRALQGADIVCPDGYPLAWIGRTVFGSGAKRVCGPDFLDYMATRSPNYRLRHYFFGGAPGVAEQLVATLKAQNPDMIIAGTDTPPMGPSSPDQLDEQLAKIDAAKPDLVWVGLGAPKQEIWMAENRHRLEGMTLLGVGAAFDFHSGRRARAPLWMRDHGLEWLFRCASEPRRLVPRYGRIIPRFVWLMMSGTLRNWWVRRQQARGARGSEQA